MANDLSMQSITKQEIVKHPYRVVRTPIDLAKAFKKLSSFDYQLLDYLIEQADFANNKTNEVTADEFLRAYNFEISKVTYRHIAQSIRRLNDKTYFYKLTHEQDSSVKLTKLFISIEINEDDNIVYKFTKDAASILQEFKEDFSYFTLSEMLKVQSKNVLTLMSLWSSKNQRKTNNDSISISGSVEQWKHWFNKDNVEVSNGEFVRDVVKRATKDFYAEFGIASYVTLDKEKGGVTNRIQNINIEMKKYLGK